MAPRPPEEEETNEMRKQRIKETCQQLHLTMENSSEKYSAISDTASTLLVDDTHRVMYCAVPKAGCSTWKTVLLQMASGKDIDTLKADEGHLGVHKRTVQRKFGLKSLADYTPEEQRQRLDSYFKFTVVRHPFTRLVSGYKDKFHSKNRLLSNSFGRAVRKGNFSGAVTLKWPESDDISFSTFIKSIAAVDKDTYYNIHWASMSQVCQPCFIDYDYIGKVETMERDAKVIFTRMGVSNMTLPHRNSHQQKEDYNLYYTAVPKEALKSVWMRFYQIDSLLFNYPLPAVVLE